MKLLFEPHVRVPTIKIQVFEKALKLVYFLSHTPRVLFVLPVTLTLLELLPHYLLNMGRPLPSACMENKNVVECKWVVHATED